MKQRLAASLVGTDDSRARTLLERLQEETNDALENLRDLARGIYPPLLADEGLSAALESQARKSPIPVRVDPDSVGRYPQEIESAVYFCALEALNNVGKYAQASSATIRLEAADGELRFEISDDGIGFDPDTRGAAAGSRGWPTASRRSAASSTSAAPRAPGPRSRASCRSGRADRAVPTRSCQIQPAW